MVDFIRIYYHDKEELELLVKNPNQFSKLFNVTEVNSSRAGYPLRTSLGSMDITVYENKAEIVNSLHVLYNYIHTKEKHNYNDFSYSMLIEMIDLLSKEIPGSTTTTISKLEFGLNISTELPAKDIIRNNVLMHKDTMHSENNKYSGKGELKRFTHSDYHIKMYDKQKQFGLLKNTLRFEIVFTKSRLLNSLGVSTLSCLRQKANLRKLFLYLIKRLKEMVIVDDFDGVKDKIDICLLYKFTNTLYWKSHIAKRTPQTKYNHRKKFEILINKYGLNSIKKDLNSALIKKFVLLINN
ncbi:hypothetical protein GWA97_06415 [Flavobacterium sp. LaA7.5]|nr:hypothetical protein [Flavobacterium salilacus subsp. altitudinum]